MDEKRKQEMVALLSGIGLEFSQDAMCAAFAIAGGLYQYCCDYHGGQDSGLYAIAGELITPPIGYRPAMGYDIHSGDFSDDLAIYELLENEDINPSEMMEILKETLNKQEE